MGLGPGPEPICDLQSNGTCNKEYFLAVETAKQILDLRLDAMRNTGT